MANRRCPKKADQPVAQVATLEQHEDDGHQH
jgi:hypothetical protein